MRRSGQVLTDVSHGGHIVEDSSPEAVTMTVQRTDLTRVANAVAGIAPAALAAARAAPPAPAAASTVGPVEFETRFDYLFSGLVSDASAHLPAENAATIESVYSGLEALGDAMVEDSLAPGEGPLQATGNSTIPAIYTYWGQFIDHDLTANTDRDSAVSNITVGKAKFKPLKPSFVVKNLVNRRLPTVNLDSVYGDGPTFPSDPPTQAAKFYDGIKFRLGAVALNPVPAQTPPPIPGVPIPPDTLDATNAKKYVSKDPYRDLPRIGPLLEAKVVKETDFSPELRAKPNFRSLALIADARNDENLIVAQLHVAFLRFHNSAVDWVRTNEKNYKTEEQIFVRAQQLTVWHHQWLVVNDYLKTMTLAGTTEKVLLGKPKFFKPRGSKPWMPLEFSVAAFRFGHTMVRAAYDHNRNFGRPEPGTLPVLDNASFDNMFSFTGNGSPPFRGGTTVLPFNWIIEWDRFIDKGSLFPDHFARKIDTRLAPPLRAMFNEGNNEHDPDIKAILKRLARRNLLRGYLLSMPTGQKVAETLKVEPLSAAELSLGNSGPLNQVLEDNGFLERTPLWYYILKEAEVRANGNSLGEVGSRIVCETIIGQLLNDPGSYLRQPGGGWNPGKGVRLPGGDPVVTIRDFIRFGGIIA